MFSSSPATDSPTAHGPIWSRWRTGATLLGGLALGAGLTTSCALKELKQNVKQIDAHGVIAVNVSPVPTNALTYALAWTQATDGTNEMIGFQTVESGRPAVFLLRPNRTFRVGAFTDLNGNVAYDGGEPVAWVENVRPVPLADTQVHSTPILLALSATNGLPRGQHWALPRENPELGDALPVSLGKIASLDDPKFSAAVGEAGMWRPFEFVLEHGYGVYFLEPYSPRKMPVLFVYGIAGSPQDWRTLIEKLDRKKYQPWFFHYPSGLRLDKSAGALAGGMQLLRQQYGFREMAVVAHSMGGLVSRGAIQRAIRHTGTNFIPHFVTISTPWGGHQAAELGVNHLRFPVPSWRDMVPGSEYLQRILSDPLPAGTRHDLIFGYKSSGSLGLPDENDGVVAVSSELVVTVQENAASVLGLYEDHTSILSSPVTLQRVHQSLAR